MPDPRVNDPAGARQEGRVVRRRWLVGGSALFIAAMIGSTAHDLWLSRRDAQRQAEQEIVVLARVLAEQTRRSLQTVDVVLRELAEEHREGRLPAAGPPLDGHLDRQRSALSDVALVFLSDAQGSLLASAAAMPGAPRDVAAQPAFRQLQLEPGAGTLVDRVAHTLDDGHWRLPIVHRLEREDGRFEGVAGALLDADYFERFYEDVQLERGNLVALTQADGTLVARHPPREAAVGQPFAEWLEGDAPGPRRYVSAIDRTERVGVSQNVPGYGLNIVVARDADLVFAPWREAAWGSVVRTALLCAAALGLLAVVLRQLERLEAQRTSQKLEAMGTLAGGIAHDFNNILGAILGYAELAQGQAAPGSALHAQLHGVMSAAMRAKSLVQRILAFSRGELGDRVPVHVQSVVAEALDLLEASMPAGIALHRDLRAGDAALVADPAQVHQVVMNLGTNAVQASRSPGLVSVALAPRSLERPLHATSAELPPGEYLELVVRDDGTGIEPAQIDRIFDPFFTTKDVGVGTGLGLSLVHGIVGELRGAIDVHSEPGRGSAFTVLLPWSGQVMADPQRRGGEEALPRGNGHCVLLVDDEPALVALGEETLAALGYEPVGYTSSVDALGAFEQHPQRYDAVLTDETMPELTGSQLAAAVRRLRPDVPVLLVSGYVGPALAARAQQAGVREVLAKPLAARDLARALAKALEDVDSRP